MALLGRIRNLIKLTLQLGPQGPALYAVYRLGLITGHYRRLERGLLRAVAAGPAVTIPPVALPDPQLLRQTVGRRQRSRLVRDASAVIAGKIHPFGGPFAPLALTFRGPLRHWTDYETGRAPLPRALPSSTPSAAPKSHSGSPDPKLIWEPARFGWAYTLGRAFVLSGNPKFALAFWKHFEKFDRGNPAFAGPNWMNGQEVAIRLLALLWSSTVFASARASSARRRQRLSRSIAEHAARLPETLVYARSQNNNHLVTESAALYLAGVALERTDWTDLGWRWLNVALEKQVNTFGEYIQHSTNYHRLMLQACLLVDQELRRRSLAWPARSSLALMRASHWLFSMIDPTSGRAPNLGANDGALILPLTSCAHDDFRPTVQAAARAFLRTGLPSGPWDELSLWLGLDQSRYTADSAAYAAEQVRGRNSWAYVRASSFRSRLSHIDQLHTDLWWKGLNLAADPGTYSYNALPPWDNPLVSTRLHNTVTVDGRDQMTRAGRFLVLDWVPAYSKTLVAADSAVLGRTQAWHGAYARLGVRHERLVTSFESGRWEIRDDLHFARSGRHTLRLHWLLRDGEWSLKSLSQGVLLRLKVPGGWLSLQVNCLGAAHLVPSITLIRAGRLLRGSGGALPYEGWISPTYNVKRPALSLAVEVVSDSSCSFVSEFHLPA